MCVGDYNIRTKSVVSTTDWYNSSPGRGTASCFWVTSILSPGHLSLPDCQPDQGLVTCLLNHSHCSPLSSAPALPYGDDTQGGWAPVNSMQNDPPGICPFILYLPLWICTQGNSYPHSCSAWTQPQGVCYAPQGLPPLPASCHSRPLQWGQCHYPLQPA